MRKSPAVWRYKYTDDTTHSGKPDQSRFLNETGDFYHTTQNFPGFYLNLSHTTVSMLNVFFWFALKR